MAAPDLRDSQYGPQGGTGVAATFITWRRYFDMRGQRRKENWDGMEITDFQRRAIEVLVVQAIVNTQSCSPNSVEFLLLQSRAIYDTIETQSPDENNVAVWVPILPGTYWYIDNLTAVEIAPDVTKLQLTVKTWGKFLDVEAP